MIGYLTLIFTCQLLGELTVRLLGLPLPGPVVGMVMLFVFLLLRKSVPEGLDQASGGLLKAMSLLFVPAGTGVMLHFRALGEALLPLGLALVVSTFLTILVTAKMMQWLAKGNADE